MDDVGSASPGSFVLTVQHPVLRPTPSQKGPLHSCDPLATEITEVVSEKAAPGVSTPEAICYLHPAVTTGQAPPPLPTWAQHPIPILPPPGSLPCYLPHTAKFSKSCPRGPFHFHYNNLTVPIFQAGRPSASAPPLLFTPILDSHCWSQLPHLLLEAQRTPGCFLPTPSLEVK